MTPNERGAFSAKITELEALVKRYRRRITELKEGNELLRKALEERKGLKSSHVERIFRDGLDAE